MRRPDFATLLQTSLGSLRALAQATAIALAKSNLRTQPVTRSLPGGAENVLGALPLSHYTLQAI
jgi:hypothetical protein